ncbi:hypothetical protein QUB05_09930 [Microcoleus sp. F10-C6]|uniref:hypothetical protein n=1 Tax=unclassified Microcoleus TaxID=2642155 RepID=UPI002FD10FC3
MKKATPRIYPGACTLVVFGQEKILLFNPQNINFYMGGDRAFWKNAIASNT